MKTTIKQFDQALEVVDQDYERYTCTMIDDGMIPLSFKEWAELKDPHHEEWVD